MRKKNENCLFVRKAQVTNDTMAVKRANKVASVPKKAAVDDGVHSSRIADENTCDVVCKRLADTPIRPSSDEYELLLQTARSALNSNRDRERLAKICVDAVLSVADLDRKDVNLDFIKVEGKVGGTLEDTCLVKGIVLDKDFSNEQMLKEHQNPKIVILSCAFELPLPMKKRKLHITSDADMQKLLEEEQDCFCEMVTLVKESGADLVICQWGVNDAANHLLHRNEIPVIRWVNGVDIERIAVATGGRIVPKLEEITPTKFGTCGIVREVSFATANDRLIFIEECPNSRAVTIFIRGDDEMIIEDAKRALHNALCMVRNVICDNRSIDGSAESVASHAVTSFADTSLDQHAIRGDASKKATKKETKKAVAKKPAAKKTAKR